jgi:hypothetical protein
MMGVPCPLFSMATGPARSAVDGRERLSPKEERACHRPSL